MTTTDTVRSGVWTPWGEALCPDCHRHVGPWDHADTTARTQRVQTLLDAGEILSDTPTRGFCSANPGQDRRGCGTPIWLPPHVAPLTRLKPHFPGAQLQQTGGMGAALMIPSPADPQGPVVVVTADEAIVLGRFPSRQSWTDGEFDATTTTYIDLPEDTPDAAIIARIHEVLP